MLIENKKKVIGCEKGGEMCGKMNVCMGETKMNE
jgi:hypothetical protein